MLIIMLAGMVQLLLPINQDGIRHLCPSDSLVSGRLLTSAVLQAQLARRNASIRDRGQHSTLSLLQSLKMGVCMHL